MIIDVCYNRKLYDKSDKMRRGQRGMLPIVFITFGI